jgi:hypothetical protein
MEGHGGPPSKLLTLVRTGSAGHRDRRFSPGQAAPLLVYFRDSFGRGEPAVEKELL